MNIAVIIGEIANISRNDIMSTMLARINHKWQYGRAEQAHRRGG